MKNHITNPDGEQGNSTVAKRDKLQKPEDPRIRVLNEQNPVGANANLVAEFIQRQAASKKP